jgi:hypothetical protein
MKRYIYVPLILFSFLVVFSNNAATQLPMPGEESYVAVAEIMPEPIGD